MAHKNALLFINGIPPKELPDFQDFQLIACTDGAFHYLKEKNFPIEKLDFISGDFDSHHGKDEHVLNSRFIHTPDQNKTDFHKALEIIIEKGFKEVSVYGASGREQDHFLGNLHVALMLKDQISIKFSDEYSTYFFIPNQFQTNSKKGKIYSLIPFPFTERVSTKGLHWPLNKEKLSLTTRIGTRNMATENQVSISFEKGALLLFIEK